MNHNKLGQYQIISGDGESGLRFKSSLWSRPRFLPFQDIHQVEIFSDLLLIYHDRGIASLNRPRTEPHRPLLSALQNLPDANYREFDRPGNIGANHERLGAFVFYTAFMLIIAALLYLNPLDDETTQPFTYIIFLVPAFCLAYLARLAAAKLISAFRKTR